MRYGGGAGHILAFVGYTSSWAIAVLASLMAAVYLDGSSFQAIYQLPTVLFYLGAAIGSCCFTWAFRRLERLSVIPLACGCIPFSVGTVLATLSLVYGLMPNAVGYVSHLFMGFGSVSAVIAWSHIIRASYQDDAEEMLVKCSCSALGLMLVAMLVLHLLGMGAWLTIHVLLALTSMVCFYFSRKFLSAERRDALDFPNMRNSHLLPKGMGVAVFVACAAVSALSFAGPSLPAVQGRPVLAGLLLALALVAVLGSAFGRIAEREGSFAPALKLSFVILTACLAIELAGAERIAWAVDSVAYLSYFSILLALFVSMDRIAARAGVSVAYLCSMWFAFASFGLLTGALLSTFDYSMLFPGLSFDHGAVSSLLLVAAVAAMAVVLAFLLDEKKVDGLWGVVPDGKPWDVDEVCESIATERGLTERQREVLVLLVQGKSVREVEEALTISNGTARTHVRNIYAKLGVHSFSELMSFVFKTFES